MGSNLGPLNKQALNPLSYWGSSAVLDEIFHNVLSYIKQMHENRNSGVKYTVMLMTSTFLIHDLFFFGLYCSFGLYYSYQMFSSYSKVPIRCASLSSDKSCFSI